MGRAVAKIDVQGTLAEVEAHWLDTAAWSSFVDGCEQVEHVDGPWPRASAEVQWRSVPLGRGIVNELVEEYAPLCSQTVEVRDERLQGSQRISFETLDGGVGLTLELDYRLASGGFFRGAFDVLFVRRTVADSLDRTLTRFARSLAVVQGVDQG